MAMNAAQFCDLTSPQTLKGKKTFKESIVARAFVLESGESLQVPAIRRIVDDDKNCLIFSNGNGTAGASQALRFDNQDLHVKNAVYAERFVGPHEGDGSKLTNIAPEAIVGGVNARSIAVSSPIDNTSGRLTLKIQDKCGLRSDHLGLTFDASCITQATSVNKKDFIVFQSAGAATNVSRARVQDLLALIPQQNGVLYDFVTTAKNVGSGASVFKGKRASGRSISLEYKTLVFDDNFLIEETPTEIRISLKEVAIQKILDEEKELRSKINNLEEEGRQRRAGSIELLENKITETLSHIDHVQKQHDKNVSESKKQLEALIGSLNDLTS